jgi:hypothetical protein
MADLIAFTSPAFMCEAASQKSGRALERVYGAQFTAIDRRARFPLGANAGVILASQHGTQGLEVAVKALPLLQVRLPAAECVLVSRQALK